MELFNRATGQWEEVPDAQVTNVVGSGTHAFQQGVEVPVTFPDGRIGTVPSENIEKAFKDGFRLQTQDDANAFQERENAKIKKEAFDNTAMGAATGFLRGASMGLSDIAMQAGARAYYGEGAGDKVKDALKTTEEVNPISSTVGELAGALAPMGLTAQVAGRAGRAIESAVAEPILARLATRGVASKLAGETLAKGIGGATEGVVYGLQDGISEASLGDPNEVVEHLTATPAMGALIGGAFGSMFGASKVAAPFLKDFVAKGANAADEATGGFLRAAFKKTMQPVLSAKNETEAAKLFGELADQPEFRKFIDDHGIEKAREVVKTARSQFAEAAKDARTNEKQLRDWVSRQPADTKRVLESDIKAAQGDWTEAVKQNYNRLDGARLQVSTALENDKTPGFMFDAIHGETQRVAAALRKQGTAEANRIADDLTSLADAKATQHGYQLSDEASSTRQRLRNAKLRQQADEADAALTGIPSEAKMTEGQEVLLSRELRDRAKSAMEGLDKKTAGHLDEYFKNMDYIVGTSRWRDEMAKLEKYEGAFDAARGFLTRAPKTGGVEVKEKVIRSLINDPEKAGDFNRLFSKFDEFMPEMKAVQDAGNDLVKRGNALKTMSDKLAAMRENKIGQRLTVDDLGSMMDYLKPTKDILNQFEAIKGATEALNAAKDAAGPLTRLMRYRNLMNETVDPQIAKLAAYETQYQQLQRFNKLVSPNDPKIPGVLGRFMSQGLVPAAGAYLGEQVGGTPGAVIGFAAGGLARPGAALETLTKLERLSSKGYSTINKGIEKAVDALTSTGFKRTAIATGAQNLDDARKSFKDRAAYITEVTNNPDRMAAEIEHRTKDLEHAPAIAATVAGQYVKTANFLQSKLPLDPLGDGVANLSPMKSPWQPSDMDLGKYERYVRAAENPNSVLEAIQSGTATPEAIETLQTLYPSIYGRLQERVTNVIMDPNTSLSYEQRLHLATVLDLPLDHTLSPAFIGQMQSVHANQSAGRPSNGAPGQSSPQGGRPSSVKININPDATSTPVSRITNK